MIVVAGRSGSVDGLLIAFTGLPLQADDVLLATFKNRFEITFSQPQPTKNIRKAVLLLEHVRMLRIAGFVGKHTFEP